MMKLFCKAGIRSFVAGDSIGLVTWISQVTKELKQFSTAVFTLLAKDSEAEPIKRDVG